MDKMALSNTVPGSIYTIYPTPFNCPRAYIGYEHRVFDGNFTPFYKTGFLFINRHFHNFRQFNLGHIFNYPIPKTKIRQDMLYREMLSGFDKKLKEIQGLSSSPMGEAMAGIEICNTTLLDLRIAVGKHGFKNIDVEIDFFKNVKSRPLRFLVHYTEVRSCEMKMPKWGLRAKLEFIELEIDRINTFFGHHPDFRLYMENGAVENDKRYFTRKHLNDFPLTTSYGYFKDPLFNTSHDGLWAMIKGLALYGNYLTGLNAKLNDASNEASGLPEKKDPPFRFTMSPTAAVEFIYAFKELRAFDHGNFDIKPFTDYFGEVFGIEIKDPYGLFAQIANRKTNRAKYVQMLLDAFQNSLDRRDGYS